jgi:hypothetical protein
MSVEDMLDENKVLSEAVFIDPIKYSDDVNQITKSLVISICKKQGWRCGDLIGQNFDASERRDAICTEIIIFDKIEENNEGILTRLFSFTLNFLYFRRSSCSYWPC